MRSISTAHEVTVPGTCRFKYSICTLVNRHQEYREVMDSFLNAGFLTEDCEYLYIDNSESNKSDAFTGYNRFLDSAQGQYVILCHQDILTKYDDRKALERCLAELDRIDPAWALAGNAGGVGPEMWAARITHPTGSVSVGVLPAKAQSLDENFIVVKKSANLCLSRDLQGFHFYGLELCQIARILGWNAWVINFNLYHKSEGRFDGTFYDMSRTVVEKYQRVLKGGLVQTMGTKVSLSSSAIRNWFATPSRRRLIYEYLHDCRKRKKKGLPPVPVAPDMRGKPLGPGWFAFYWAAHRIRRPLENLVTAASRRKR